MSYTPTYKRPYEQWKELPSKETLVTAEVLAQYDDTFENIEEYLESEGKKEYALVTEAGYSIVASINEYYVLTVVLKNKAGEVLSTSEPIDLPIESMIINVDYDEESGILTFSLQNGQTLDVNISTLVRGLVPTSRTIAGVDLEDDITAEELKTALGYLTETDIAELNTSSAVAYYESEVNTAITAPAQTYTDMAKITLPIGTYVVQSSFRSNTNGFRFYQGIQVNDEYLRDTRYDSMSLVASTWVTIVRLTKETELVYRLWVDKEAIIDETQIKAVRINYNAEELDDVKSSIASVSDEVDALSEQIDKIIGIPKLEWEQGSISTSTGMDFPDDYDKHDLFVRTSNYIKVGKEIQINFPSTDSLNVYKYDSDKNFIGYEGYTESGVISTGDATFIRIRLFHRNSSAITPEYASENISIVYEDSTPLSGRIVCTYGDSITKNPTWANIVKNELGLGVIYNRGWSDSAVTLENKTLYINADGTYNSNPITTEQPEGTTEVQCSFCHDDRIAYIPTDTEIVLVMGGTNDLFRNKPIGTITNDGIYDESTFVGALISTVQKIQTRVPNATIILMTPIMKLSEEGAATPFVNNNNDTIVEFVHAVRDVADYIGCNLIDVHNCGITLFNGASKLSDATHPNSEGAELIAKSVINGLRQIFSI